MPSGQVRGPSDIRPLPCVKRVIDKFFSGTQQAKSRTWLTISSLPELWPRPTEGREGWLAQNENRGKTYVRDAT
jgi:hypothetical protein